MELKGLSNHQKQLLKLIANSDIATNFYFTGGTALSSVYLNHRFSEDLDFFNETEFNIEPIILTLKTSNYDSIDIQQSFNRNLFFLKFGDEVLKLEFTYYPFPQIEHGPKIGNLEVDSLIDIATNKLFTISQKPRSRDYIDLFFINKKQKLIFKDLYFRAKQKFDWHIDPLQLGSRFLEFDESDLDMVHEKVTGSEIREFFEAEAKKFQTAILKKA